VGTLPSVFEQFETHCPFVYLSAAFWHSLLSFSEVGSMKTGDYMIHVSWDSTEPYPASQSFGSGDVARIHEMRVLTFWFLLTGIHHSRKNFQCRWRVSFITFNHKKSFISLLLSNKRGYFYQILRQLIAFFRNNADFGLKYDSNLTVFLTVKFNWNKDTLNAQFEFILNPIWTKMLTDFYFD